MFKGIVECVGSIEEIIERETTRRFSIAAAELEGVEPGDSVAVDGCCLTVTERDAGGFSVDVIGTTLDRTAAGSYRVGARVNLERALLMGDRIDGHLVQGHVDGTAEFLAKEQDGEFWTMEFELPADVARDTVPRGSVALNGTSLTVADLSDENICRIGVIPFTYAHTNLGTLEPGDRVNVEGDLIGKYVGKMLAQRLGQSS